MGHNGSHVDITSVWRGHQEEGSDPRSWTAYPDADQLPGRNPVRHFGEQPTRRSAGCGAYGTAKIDRVRTIVGLIALQGSHH